MMTPTVNEIGGYRVRLARVPKVSPRLRIGWLLTAMTGWHLGAAEIASSADIEKRHAHGYLHDLEECGAIDRRVVDMEFQPGKMRKVGQWAITPDGADWVHEAFEARHNPFVRLIA